MEITVKISEKAGKIIQDKAKESDMGLADFAGDLLENKVKEDFPEGSVYEGPHPLLKFAGMFNSGKQTPPADIKKYFWTTSKCRAGSEAVNEFGPGRRFSLRAC